MKRVIELKHVGPKEHVKSLLEDLIGRLEEKLNHFPPDAVSLHVLFDENGTHKLFRTALTCHVPGHTVAAHEEGREAGMTIRNAFAEVERQLGLPEFVIAEGRLLRQKNVEFFSESMHHSYRALVVGGQPTIPGTDRVEIGLLGGPNQASGPTLMHLILSIQGASFSVSWTLFLRRCDKVSALVGHSWLAFEWFLGARVCKLT